MKNTRIIEKFAFFPKILKVYLYRSDFYTTLKIVFLKKYYVEQLYSTLLTPNQWIDVGVYLDHPDNIPSYEEQFKENDIIIEFEKKILEQDDMEVKLKKKEYLEIYNKIHGDSEIKDTFKYLTEKGVYDIVCIK